MNTISTRSDKQQPEALRLAELLTADEWPGHMTLVSYARECVAELRRQHAELETLRASHGQAPAQPAPDVSGYVSEWTSGICTADEAMDGIAKLYAAQAAPAAVAGPSGYGPKATVKRSCSDCKACNSESYAVQGDSGHYVYCEHPSLPESKYIGDTNWNTPHWCPVAAPATQPAPDEIINMAREQGLPETEIEGVFRVNADDLCRVAAAILAARAPADSVTAPAAYSGNIEQELAMLIRRIVSSARRNCEDGSNVLKLANEAWVYLVRKGLNGSPLRDAGIESDPTPAAQAADSVLEDAGGANWQDISTAPKDGTRFVAVGNNYGLYSEMQHTCIAQWFRGCWIEASDWNETSELKYLTHWMPLLPLPGSAARKQGGAT